MSLARARAELQKLLNEEMNWALRHPATTVDEAVRRLAMDGRLGGMSAALDLMDDILKEDEYATGD